MLYSSLFYPILPQRRIPARRPGEDVIQCLVQMFLGFVLFFWGVFFGFFWIVILDSYLCS